MLLAFHMLERIPRPSQVRCRKSHTDRTEGFRQRQDFQLPGGLQGTLTCLSLRTNLESLQWETT